MVHLLRRFGVERSGGVAAPGTFTTEYCVSLKFLIVTLRIAEVGCLCPGQPLSTFRSQSVLDGGSSY